MVVSSIGGKGMSEDRTEEIRRAEDLLARRFETPTSPVDVLNDVIQSREVGRYAARKAFAEMLYMGRIRYQGPNHVVVVSEKRAT